MEISDLGGIRGCSAPLMVGAPIALKLYGLNLTVFQVPLFKVNGNDRHLISETIYLASISTVRSVSSLTNSFANLGPLLNL